ncbi:glycosyltransferase family 4 protein [Cohnella algarum]|uniref:glycosyltransferase family 4 protein n=1 Tax=Cohnella algarum TaxID=2044859 RepID=UPI0019686767|nr:glycosyltransferase family 4 protein [Cohnella algarum]MBN2980652.1 glycosyltransferase family 4 protein [Cohnella algarum]
MNYIIFPGELDIRRGGPSGYLANLQEGIQEIQREKEVRFISKRSDGIISKDKVGKLKKIIGKSNFLTEKIMKRKSIQLRHFPIHHELSSIVFQKGDIVHVHNVMDYNFLMKYNLNGAKVILTPHTPESIADEFVEVIRSNFNNQRLKLKNYKSTIKKIEDSVFNKCEYFIFPSKESMEIYSSFIQDFDKIMLEKKIFFNLTGSKPLNYFIPKDAFRSKLGISQEAFVISYIGRHNSIKGFDILVKVAKEIYKIDKDIIFISGGTGNIKSDSPNFIEVGWTDDPGSIVNASDLFILPNRNTYFDLVMLEVLSLGIPVIASSTGGNKSIAKLTEGIILFENENITELVQKILILINNRDNLIKMGELNRSCYYEYFTLQHFSKRYLEVLKQIKNKE